MVSPAEPSCRAPSLAAFVGCYASAAARASDSTRAVCVAQELELSSRRCGARVQNAPSARPSPLGCASTSCVRGRRHALRTLPSQDAPARAMHHPRRDRRSHGARRACLAATTTTSACTSTASVAAVQLSLHHARVRSLHGRLHRHAASAPLRLWVPGSSQPYNDGA